MGLPPYLYLGSLQIRQRAREHFICLLLSPLFTARPWRLCSTSCRTGVFRSVIWRQIPLAPSWHVSCICNGKGDETQPDGIRGSFRDGVGRHSLYQTWLS